MMKNISLVALKVAKRIFLILAGILAGQVHVLAAPVVFTPERLPTGPIGIFIRVDYERPETPQAIDYSKPDPDKGWLSVVSNYYFILQNQDKAGLIDLHTERDGGKAIAEEHAGTLLSLGSDVTISRVDFEGMFRVGRLYVPLINSEITPVLAGSPPVIVCYEDGCYKTFGQWKPQFGDLFRSIKGEHAKYLRPLTSQELNAFEARREELQRYIVVSHNPQHLTPENEALYPNIYLDLKNYYEREHFNLERMQASEFLDSNPEIVPVLNFLIELKSLDSEILNDQLRLAEIYLQAFDDPMAAQTVLPIFKLEGQGYLNSRIGTRAYAKVVKQWDEIVPVGYLDQGKVRYVFFYPQTSAIPLDGVAKSIIQMLPVIKTGDGYRLSYNGLPFTSLSSLQLPEAIELYMNYYDRAEASASIAE